MGTYIELDAMKKVGPRVRAILDERKIKVKVAAEDMQIDLSHYYRLLRGERSMTVDNLIAHCLYLDVSILYLLFGSESYTWDTDQNVVPGDIEIMIEKVITSIENLEGRQKYDKASKLGHRYATMIGKMD